MFHHKLSSSIIKLFFGMPGRIRTPDLLGRNQLLYPAELRAHKYIYYYKVDFYLLAMLILTAHALYSGVSVIKSTASEVKSLVLVLPGNAKTDVDIILGFYEAMGKKHKITEPSEIWKEMASTSPLFSGINYDRIEALGGIQWPCPDEDHPGTRYLHKNQMESGETGIFSPVDHIEPAEPTNEEFPFVLSTGRRRSTYHTGTQTGKAKGFDEIISEELVEINPFDAKNLSIKEKDKLSSSFCNPSILCPCSPLFKTTP